MDVLGIYSYISVIPILMRMPATKTSMFVYCFPTMKLFCKALQRLRVTGNCISQTFHVPYTLLQFLAHLCRRKSKFHDSHLKGSKL